MSCAPARRQYGRRLASAIVMAVAVASSRGAAQPAQRQSLLQLEVGDSIGLPLPDATLEVFTFLEGGIAWEWAAIDVASLPAGTNLLRISNPGYRPAVLSIPLREGSRVSLRVRLDPAGDTARQKSVIQAREVHAIGLALEGRARTDIIGLRRVLDREAIELADANTLGALLRRAKGTDLIVLPVSGGSFRADSRSNSGGGSCPVQVMVNGDRRRLLPFSTAEQLFSTSEIEALEIFPRGSSVPLWYRPTDTGCGVLVVWFRNP